MIKRILFLFFALIINSQILLAVKAYPYPVEITQPDGTKITIILKGDEHVKWAQTADGYSILRNSKGVYEYAMLDSNNDMIPSGIHAKNQKERGNSDIIFLNKIKKGIVYSRSQVGIMKSISKMSQKGYQKSFPTTGTLKLVCVLVEFTDTLFKKNKTDFNNLFNQVGYNVDGATGSVYDYYKENSWGNLSLSVTVAGPYKVSHNMAYYGANDANDNDVKPQALITEAVTLANPDVKYSDFDNDGNGIVDGVYVIYAGYGEEVSGVSPDAVWAHAWSISPLTLDGVSIRNYSCSAERRGNSGFGIARIGVICHEFGHVLGASDYYDTDYASSGGEYDGTGDWDLMSNGSWNNHGITPAHHNPYTKIVDYRWTTATTLTTTGVVTLNNAELYSNSFYRINTSTPNEYFLIENRQRHKFDSYLPGHGMIIYHVDGDYIESNAGSNDINTSSHQGMYPVCASSTGNPPLEYGSISTDGCPFPGSYFKTSFDDYSNPYSRSWAGANTYKAISNIVENSITKTVTFNLSLTTGVALANGEVVNLSQNYPNPFDQSTTIDFNLVKPSYVKLTVFNNLGKEVDVIVNEYLTNGTYSKRWEPKNLPNGIYYYQLKIGRYKETRRLIIMK